MRAIGCATRGRAVGGGWYGSEHRQMLEVNSEWYSNAVNGVRKDYMAMILYETD